MANIGLVLNHTKCEIILPTTISDEQRTSTIHRIHQIIPGAVDLKEHEMTTLGAPITEAAAELTLGEKREELERMLERLQLLDAHSAFFLPRNSIWLPKLKYLLRAAPIYRQSALLQQLDDSPRAALTTITNVNFNDESWEQAVLPTRYGGLGLRSTVDISLPSHVSCVMSPADILHTTRTIQYQRCARTRVGS